MLNTVIKHTQTIAEYKQVRQNMTDNAAQYEAAHHMAFENGWTHGEAVKTWYDGDGVQCIEYADGSYWHYKATANGIEWW